MVLDSLASSILNRILGDYVSGFDSTNVKFSFSGELTLHNLQLKSSALDKLGLPVRVRAGTLSKLYLQVPWRSLGSQPAIVKIESLNILAVPASRSKDDYNAEEEEKAKQAAKQRKLALAESYKQARKKSTEDTSKSDDTFVQRLLNSILSTLQLTISNLHVRIEDPGMPSNGAVSEFSCMPFAAGLSVSSLEGLSTDSQWNASTTSGSLIEILLYKLLDVQNYSVYLDINDNSVYDYACEQSTLENPVNVSTGTPTKQGKDIDPRRFNEIMERTMSERCDKGPHAYLLEPTGATFKVTLNRNAANFDYAQLDINSLLHTVSIGLRPPQLQAIVFISKRFEYFNTASRYLKWRPSETPMENPRKWWQFVINCVVQDVRKRREPWLPATIDLRRKRRKAYVPLYMRVIDQTATQLSNIEKRELADLECDLTFEDILFFRSLAEIRVQNEKAHRTTAPPVGWGQWMTSFVWSSPTTSSDLTTPTSTSSSSITSGDSFWESIHLTEDETNQLFDAIHFDRSSGSSGASRLKPPKDYVKHHFFWKQEVGQLKLFDAKESPLVSFSFRDLWTDISIGDSKTFFETSLASLVLNDEHTTNTHFPRLVSPQSLLSDEPLLKLALTVIPSQEKERQLETANSSGNKQDQDSSILTPDYTVDLSLKRLNIVLNLPLTRKISQFFLEALESTSNPGNYSSQTQQHDATASGLTQTHTGVQDQSVVDSNAWTSWTHTKRRNEQLLALANLKKQIRLKIKIEAPNVLIPQDCTFADSRILMLALGTFTVSSKLSSHQHRHHSRTLSEESAENREQSSAGSVSASPMGPTLHPPVLHITTSSPSSSLSNQHKDIDVTGYYDRYNFSIAGIQAVMTRTNKLGAIYGLTTVPRSTKALSQNAHILYPISCAFSLAVCKINVESMPNVKLTASLPALRLVLSSSKIDSLKRLISSISKQTELLRRTPTAIPVPQHSVQPGNSTPSSTGPTTTPFGPTTVSKIVDDMSFTQSIVVAAEKLEEEDQDLVPLGLGVSIEADIPEIEVTLVHKKPKEIRLKPNYSSSEIYDEAMGSQDNPLGPSTFDPSHDLVRLRLTHLGYRLETYPKSIQLNAFLRALSIEDFSQDVNSQFRYLANSYISSISPDDASFEYPSDSQEPADTSLIHISYKHHIQDDNPSFNGVQNHCKLRFNQLTANLCLGTIGAIYTYIAHLTKSVDPDDMSIAHSVDSAEPKGPGQLQKIPSSSTVSSSLSPNQTKLTIATAPQIPKIYNGKEVIDFLLDVEIRAILINFIEANTKPLAEISLSRSSASFNHVAGKGYTLKAKLGNMKVIDTSIPDSKESSASNPQDEASTEAETSRKHVISVRGSHMIEFKLTNVQETPRSADRLDDPFFTLLDVQINTIRILLNPRWLFKMILNIGELIAVFSPPAPNKTEAELALEIPTDPATFLASPHFFSYRVKILRPYIILTQDETSNGVIITDLGHIDVSQTITEVDPDASNPIIDPQGHRRRKFFDKVTVSLQKVNASSGQLNALGDQHMSPMSDFVNTRAIMSETDILVSITSSFIAHSAFPRSDSGLDVHVGAMNLFLSPEQVKLIVQVLKSGLFFAPSEADILRALQRALADEDREMAKLEHAKHLRELEAAKDEPQSAEASNKQTPVSILEEKKTVRIQLDKITLEAHDHYLLFPNTDKRFISVAPQTPPKLLSMELLETKVTWTNFSDDSLRLGFQVSSISISDLRPHQQRESFYQPSSTFAHRPILLGAPQNSKSKKSQLVGSCVTVPNKGQVSTSLTLNDLQFMPEASFIQHVWANLSPLLLGDFIGLLAHREHNMNLMFTPRQSQKWFQQKNHPEAGATYNISLNRPQIILSCFEMTQDSSWIKFADLTAANCEFGLRFMSNLQSYDLRLNELSVSLGETNNRDLRELFKPGRLPYTDSLLATSDHNIYHYNILSPFSSTTHMIFLPTAHDFTVEFQDTAKLAFSYNDFKNLRTMVLPFTIDQLNRNGEASTNSGGDAKSIPFSAHSQSQAHQAKMIIKDAPNIPTISDQVEYQLVRTDARYRPTNVDGSSTAQAKADPRREHEYLANLDEDRKKSSVRVPDLTLGTELASLPPKDAETSPTEPVEPPSEFLPKKLMVFTPKIQIMLMDNKEYDLGIVRMELSAQQMWIQDWNADSYKQSLTPAQKALLVKLSIGDQEHHAHDRLPHMKAAIGAYISADCYNPKAAAWEPLAERFLLDVGVTDRSVIIKSEHHLNLTISETLLSSYKRFSAVVDNSSSLSPSASPAPGSSSETASSPRAHTTSSSLLVARHRVQAAHYIKNETGLPLKYQLFHEDPSITPSEERLVAAGGEEPIILPSVWSATTLKRATMPFFNPSAASSSTTPPVGSTRASLDRATQAAAQRHFTISAQVHSFLTASNLSVDHIGTQVAHIGSNRLLIIEIQHRLGAKVITFKSRVSIHNNTPYPLVVGKEMEHVPFIPTLHQPPAFQQARNKSASTSALLDSSGDHHHPQQQQHEPQEHQEPPARISMDSERPTTSSSTYSTTSSLGGPKNLAPSTGAPTGHHESSRTSLDGRSTTLSSGSSVRGVIKHIATIEPYGLFHLPLDCLTDTILRFRPGDISNPKPRSSTSGAGGGGYATASSQTNQSGYDIKFSWSQMRCDVRNLKPSDPLFVECLPPRAHVHASSASTNTAPDLSNIFLYTVGVSRMANKSAILAGADQLVIHFQPPLILENLLPATMTFSIEPEPTPSVSASSPIHPSLRRQSVPSAGLTFPPKVGKLKKSAKLPIHQIPSRCRLSFRMNVRGFNWTAHGLIRDQELAGPLMENRKDASRTPVSTTLSKHLDLMDTQGRKLQILIENRINDLGTRIVTFHTPFWILNKTGLPLLARAHLSQTQSIGAGMIGLYTPFGEPPSISDVIDERNGSGIYGGDLRDLFMADLSAGCSQSPSTRDSTSQAPSTSVTPRGPDQAPILYEDSPRTLTYTSSSSSFGSEPDDGSQPNRVNQKSCPKKAKSNTSYASKPMMYNPSGYENRRIHIKVGESRWSDSLVLNTQNDSTVLSILETEVANRPRRKYELAVTVRPAANQFWRTRVVTISPRYMLINKTNNTIFLRQMRSAIACSLLPGEHAPLHWMDASTGVEKFRIKLNLPKCTWSGPIDPTQLEMFTLKLFNSETGLRYLIRVMVRMHPETAITTITFKEEDLNAPLFRIDNYTNATLLVRQPDIDYATEAIPPLQRRVWGWIEPAYQSHRVQVLFNTVDKVALSFSLAKVKAHPPIQFHTAQGTSVWLFAEVSTERTTRVLSIRPITNPSWDPLRKRHYVRYRPPTASMPSSRSTGLRRIPTNQSPRSSSPAILDSPSKLSPISPTTAAQIQAELDVEDEENILEETLRLQVQLAKVSVSLVNAEPLELIYGSLTKIDVNYVNYSIRWSLDVKIRDVQIDNQIPTTFFPVAVYSLGDAPVDWLRFSMIRSSEYMDIIYQPFVSLLLRETTIRLDETLLLKLLDLTGVTLASLTNTGKTALLTSNVDVMSLGDDEDSSKMIYNHLYILNPIALSISFATSGTRRGEQVQHIESERILAGTSTYPGDEGEAMDRKQTNAFLGIPDKFIPSVESAPIALNALMLKHSFVSYDQLRDRILQHYKSQLIRQLYAILGSFEALGNPISLVSNLGTGVKDLFYEPAKGIAISPEEFGAGLRRGGASFVTKSVAGLFNSTSKVLRAVGSGMAFISMDDEYQARRDTNKRREQPTNALLGVATGLKEFGEGIVEGVAGVFVQPIRGFQQEGALGIAKGVGRGLIGAAVKPVIGTLDLVQRTTEGISNTAAPKALLRRIRNPRYIAPDGLLRPYDARNSLAMHMLHSIENSAFSHEEYWGYVLISNPSRELRALSHELFGWFILASSHRLVLLSRLPQDLKTTATRSSEGGAARGAGGSNPASKPSSRISSPSSSLASSSAATAASSSSKSKTMTTTRSPSVSAPPRVEVQWTVTYPTIIEINKFQAENGGFKLKLSSRTMEGTTINHLISCIDVNHLMILNTFIVENRKKWEAFAHFISSNRPEKAISNAV